MKLSDLWTPRKRVKAVQTAAGEHPFAGWMRYQPLAAPELGLYAAIREGVPLVDAALDKIVRLTGGFQVICTDSRRQRELDDFVEHVKVGASSQGLRQFVSVYLDSLLTFGNAVGEIVPSGDGRDIHALYNAKLEHLHIRRGKNPLEAELFTSGDGFSYKPVRWPHLVLFTPLNPPAGEVKGVSLLRSLPFVANVLMKIFQSTGVNFDRVANLRYAVTYRPGSSGIDRMNAREIAETIAGEWADAMDSQKAGIVKDFVAVGDVGIQVIGADNQMIDTEVPVRQMLEQIVAKLGIPPFMLGLHWSSTERMSAQQADILTSELASYQSLLTGVIGQICRCFLRMRGSGAGIRVEWDDINLQDRVEEANVRLTEAKARLLEKQLEDEGR